jgi:hypothetical protein
VSATAERLPETFFIMVQPITDQPFNGIWTSSRTSVLNMRGSLTTL